MSAPSDTNIGQRSVSKSPLLSMGLQGQVSIRGGSCKRSGSALHLKKEGTPESKILERKTRSFKSWACNSPCESPGRNMSSLAPAIDGRATSMVLTVQRNGSTIKTSGVNKKNNRNESPLMRNSSQQPSPFGHRVSSFVVSLPTATSRLPPSKKYDKDESPPDTPRLFNTLKQNGRQVQSITRKTMPSIINPSDQKNTATGRTWRLQSALIDSRQCSAGMECFPSQVVLDCMPSLVSDTIIKFALDRLVLHFLPAARLWLRKNLLRSRIETKSELPKPSIESLQKASLFKSWPDIHLVQERLLLHSVDSGTIIVHEGEQASSGLFFLASGVVEVVKKKERSIKGISSNNKQLVSTLSAPSLFGEYSILTDEPRHATIRAITEVDLWVLRKSDFINLFSSLPEAASQQVQFSAFEQRKSVMFQAYPMTPVLLRNCQLFKDVSDVLLIALIEKLQPYFVPAGDVVCKAGEVAADVYFLRHGKVGVFKSAANQETLLKKLGPPAVFGEMALLFVQKRIATIRTLTPCALWLLSKADFLSALSFHNGARDLMMQQTAIQQQAWLQEQACKYNEWVRNTPLLCLLNLDLHLWELLMSDLSDAFTPRVSPKYTAVVSHSQLCDKLIIITAGKAMVRDEDAEVVVGECIGFSCLIPHKWIAPVIAHESVECLELPCDTYRKILEKHGVYKKVLYYTKCMLHPVAMPKEDVTYVLRSLQGIRTPPLYPVNRVCSWGFFFFFFFFFFFNKKNKNKINKHNNSFQQLFHSLSEQFPVNLMSAIQKKPDICVNVSPDQKRKDFH